MGVGDCDLFCDGSWWVWIGVIFSQLGVDRCG